MLLRSVIRLFLAWLFNLSFTNIFVLKLSYNTVANFKRIPGQMYLLMVLKVCHDSFAYKVEDTGASLTILSLSDYPSENVSNLSNEAHRLIKIIKGGYCLHYQLESTRILQVCKTQSDYFNQSILNLLNKVLETEKAH